MTVDVVGVLRNVTTDVEVVGAASQALLALMNHGESLCVCVCVRVCVWVGVILPLV